MNQYSLYTYVILCALLYYESIHGYRDIECLSNGTTACVISIGLYKCIGSVRFASNACCDESGSVCKLINDD